MTDREYQEITPVFICGHYRSGTSLLNHLLDGHPNVVACPIETKFFSSFLPLINAGISVADALKKTLLRHFYVHPDLYEKSYGNLDKEVFLNSFNNHFKSLDLVGSRALDAYVRACKETMNPNKAPKIWIEKTPMNEVFADQIISLWPKAKFIHIVRDPRDMHHTIRSRSDFNLKPRTTAHNWTRSVSALNKNRASIGGQRYFWLTYERLTAEPEACMVALLEFLKLDFDDCVLRPTAASGRNEWGGNAQKENHKGVTTKSVGRWRKSRFQKDMKIIEAMLKEKMSRLGYQPELTISAMIFANALIQKFILRLKVLRYTIKGQRKAAY